jgi:tubulin polyglutamylase TTLL6/13
VHLTNYAINKNNKKFVFNTSEKHMNVGHKRSLTSIFNLLKARGVDTAAINNKIDKLIVKTLLVGKPMLYHMYGLSQMDNLANDHCFHILGFDVILD